MVKKDVAKKPNKSKNPKVPYPILMAQRKKKRERDQRKRERDRESGNLDLVGRGSRKKRKAGQNLTLDQRLKRDMVDRRGIRGVGDGSRGFKGHSVGTFSQGVLYLSKSDIAAVESGQKALPPGAGGGRRDAHPGNRSGGGRGDHRGDGGGAVDFAGGGGKKKKGGKGKKKKNKKKKGGKKR